MTSNMISIGKDRIVCYLYADCRTVRLRTSFKNLAQES